VVYAAQRLWVWGDRIQALPTLALG
jgi:hypothetical protein